MKSTNGIKKHSMPPVTSEIVVVYVCPNCGSYYGTSRMGRLEEIFNTDLKNKNTHLRSRCPECGENRTRRYARLISPNEVAEALTAAKERQKNPT